MILTNNMCPNCFEQLSSGATRCHKCGFDIAGYNESSSALPAFTELNNGHYMVGRVLGQGGFGITYKALDVYQKTVVAIKEYVPADYSERHGKTLFPLSDNPKAARIFEHGKKSYNEEIKTLYQFKTVPGIVEVLADFSENNTSYLVMEFLDGCSLKSYVRRRGGKLDVPTARNLIYEVAQSLSVVHSKNVLHRDISPENIYLINNNQRAKLIDFGAARTYIENSESEKSVLLKPGFAPPEQYSRTGNQGTWTDIYALAATLYYIVSGKYVPDSMSRMQGDTLTPLNQLVPGVSASMSNALMRAMEIDVAKRTKTCQQFMDDLDRTGWTMIVPPPGPPVFADPVPPAPPNPPVPPVQPNPPVPPVQPNPPVPPVQPVTPVRPKRLVCRVTCVSGDRAHMGKSIAFYPNRRISVGREMNPQVCDFPVSYEKFITKVHLYVEYDQRQNKFIITDNSLNGTYTKNGIRLEKLRRAVFPPGSIVYLTREDIIIQFTVEYQ